MENFELIQNKLEGFVRRYYLNKILRGSMLFFSIGLIYFIVLALLEHFLWFSTGTRSILFWTFILVETFLLLFYLGIPFLKLTRISGGIDDLQASEIIGKHFPEVNDKLKNLLQLKENKKRSDLLLASIEQRSKELHPVPFKKAIDFKENRVYLKYLLFPVLIIGGLIVAGKSDAIFGSFSRISDHNTVYLKPAPFSFIVLNDSLSIREGENLILRVKTEGDFNPELVQIQIDGGSNFMKSIRPGFFEYEISNPKDDIRFRLRSNDVYSEEYQVELIKVPKLLNFELQIDYPSYTGFQDELMKGTGNLSVPEGSVLNWAFYTRNTDFVNFKTQDSIFKLIPEGDRVGHSTRILSNLEYSISTENALVDNYENLSFKIRVIKDAYPQIQVQQVVDSIDKNKRFYRGELEDDYGLGGLRLAYFTEDSPEELKTVDIPISKENFDEFHFVFPGNLDLEKGKNYSYYFQVFDNDAVNGSKSSRSETFSFYNKTAEEIEEENLRQQNETIEKIGKEIEKYEKSDTELEEINRLKKEKQDLNYNDRKRLEQFLQRQRQQNEMMKNYSEKLEKSLEEKPEEEKTTFEKELQERLKDNEERLKKNEELLKELEKYSEKIKEEDLGQKLEKLSKQNRNNQRSLEQLLELTKRYYIEEKKRKIARDLEDLSEEQEKLSDEEENNNSEEQKELNEKFDQIRQDLDELEKENEKLKQPKDLGREEIDEESIRKEQEDAMKDLENKNKENARSKQKKAAQMMKKMSARMQQSSMQGQQQQMQEDAETLRQILDNLIIFSFEQEDLMKRFKRIEQNNPRYASMLKEQSSLRENFRHVDDSLYALALRNPMVNDVITNKLTDVEFDIEKSIERLSENQIPQGTASQQYVVTGANDLANLLDMALASMQQMMMDPQSGSGGEDIQLPDIIEKQKELLEEMKEGMEKKGKEQQQGGEKDGEGDSEQLFEIYKQQQMLRLQMEKLIEENGLKDGGNPTEKMKDLEEQLLDKGVTEENLKRMQQLEYDLLEFEKALQKQGQSEKRQSETNLKQYQNSLQDQIDKAKEYFNSTEILNRQILPLRQIYREKVKEYFGTGRD